MSTHTTTRSGAVVALSLLSMAVARPAAPVALGQVSVVTSADAQPRPVARLVEAVSVAAQLLRIRQALGDLSDAERVRQLSAVSARWKGRLPDRSELDALVAARGTDAQRFLEKTRAALADARWPLDRTPAEYRALADARLTDARGRLAALMSADPGVIDALRPAAEVMGWTRGTSGGDHVFDGIAEDVRSALEGFTDSSLPQAGTAAAPVPVATPPSGADARTAGTIQFLGVGGDSLAACDPAALITVVPTDRRSGGPDSNGLSFTLSCGDSSPTAVGSPPSAPRTITASPGPTPTPARPAAASPEKPAAAPIPERPAAVPVAAAVPPSVPPPSTPAVGTGIALAWVGKIRDLVGPRSGQPDGMPDAEFRITLDLGEGDEVRSIDLYGSSPTGERNDQRWSSADASSWLLGVTGGASLRAQRTTTLGRFRGRTELSLNAVDPGWFDEGNFVVVEVTLGSGRKLLQTVRVGQAQPSPRP